MTNIETLAKKFYGHDRVHKDGEIVPYELVMIDNLGHKIPLSGYCHIPDDRVAEFASKFVDSTKPGGVNAHISKHLGYLPYPKTIIFKNRGSTEYVWEAPAFMVWDDGTATVSV